MVLKLLESAGGGQEGVPVVLSYLLPLVGGGEKGSKYLLWEFRKEGGGGTSRYLLMQEEGREGACLKIVDLPDSPAPSKRILRTREEPSNTLLIDFCA